MSLASVDGLSGPWSFINNPNFTNKARELQERLICCSGMFIDYLVHELSEFMTAHEQPKFMNIISS